MAGPKPAATYKWTGTQLVVTWDRITPEQGLVLLREVQRLDKRRAYSDEGDA